MSVGIKPTSSNPGGMLWHCLEEVGHGVCAALKTVKDDAGGLHDFLNFSLAIQDYGDFNSKAVRPLNQTAATVINTIEVTQFARDLYRLFSFTLPAYFRGSGNAGGIKTIEVVRQTSFVGAGFIGTAMWLGSLGVAAPARIAARMGSNAAMRINLALRGFVGLGFACIAFQKVAVLKDENTKRPEKIQASLDLLRSTAEVASQIVLSRWGVAAAGFAVLSFLNEKVAPTVFRWKAEKPPEADREDLYYVDKTVDSLDGEDKFLKLVCAVTNFFNDNVSKLFTGHTYSSILGKMTGEFKIFNDAAGALGLFSCLAAWLCKNAKGSYDCFSWHRAKLGNVVCLTGVKVIDMAKFLNAHHIVKLGKVAVERTFTLSTGRVIAFTPLNNVKDVLVIGMSIFSIWNANVEARKEEPLRRDAREKQLKWASRFHLSDLDAKAAFNGKFSQASLTEAEVARRNASGVLQKAIDERVDHTELQKMAANVEKLEFKKQKIEMFVRNVAPNVNPNVASEVKLGQIFTSFQAAKDANGGNVGAAYKLKAEAKLDIWRASTNTYSARLEKADFKKKVNITGDSSKIVICTATLGTSILMVGSLPWMAFGMAFAGLAVTAIDFGKYLLTLKVERDLNALSVPETFLDSWQNFGQPPVDPPVAPQDEQPVVPQGEQPVVHQAPPLPDDVDPNDVD